MAETKKALVFGDTHVPFHDARCWRIILQLVEAFGPDIVLHLGDLADCYSISDFLKDPVRKEHLQDELDESTALLKRLRGSAPRAAMYLFEGNHEERLRRLIWSMNDTQRELVNLRAFQNGINWPTLLDLKVPDIKFVPREGQARVKVLPKLVTKHGSLVRKWSGASARGEHERYGKGGVSGHTHRLGAFYNRDYNGAHVWWEAGCTCGLNPEYVEDPDWQQGCLLYTYVGDRFSVEPVFIQDGVAVWREKEYKG